MKRLYCIVVSMVLIYNTSNSIAQDFWMQTNGPDGGIVESITINSNAYIFAGTYGGGVFRSIDNGNRWMQVNSGLHSLYVNSLVANSHDDIFVGTNNGIYRSSDNGQSWMSINNGLADRYVEDLAKTSKDHIFASTGSHIHRSIDNGNSWMQITNSFADTYIYCLAVNSSDHVFAGTSKGIYHSTDDGNTWKQLGLPLSYVTTLAINSTDHIFAGSDGGVFRSIDNGKNWARSEVGPADIRVNSLAINSSRHVFAGTSNGVYRSEDNGDTWLSSGLKNTYIWIVAVHAGNYMFAGTDKGIFRSINAGMSWAQINIGLTNNRIFSLQTNSKGYIFAAAGGYVLVSRAVGDTTQPKYYRYSGNGDGIFRSIDDGYSWKKISNEAMLAGVYALAINSRDHIFAGTDSGSIYLSKDNGNTWKQTGLTNASVNSLIINSSDHIFAGAWGGIFRSVDSGTNWTRHDFTSTDVSCLVIGSNKHIFSGTLGDGIYRSTDNGNTWVRIQYDQVNYHVNRVHALAIKSNGLIFVGTADGIYRSSNNGNTWERVTSGLADTRITALVIAPTQEVFVGTWGGVFRSNNNGATWKKVDGGLTNSFVLSLMIQPNGHLFAGTYGSSIFRSVQPLTSVKEATSQIPASFSLKQNYPNPFNAATTIEFVLPRSSHVILKVFNMGGQEIVTLADEVISAGEHKVTWDANDLVSGVYVYRMQVDDFIETKKVVLLR